MSVVMFERRMTSCEAVAPGVESPVSQDWLDELVSRLTPIEILQIEDDIDFYRFSGRASPRLIAVLEAVEDFEGSLARTRAALSSRTSIPEAYT